MSTSTARCSTSVALAGPGEAAQTIAASLNVPYSALVEQIIDVAAETQSATQLSVSLGSIASPTLIYVRNRLGHDVGVRFQAVGADEFQIPNNGVLLIAFPAAAAAVPITALKLVTTAEQTVAGAIDVVVAGD